MKIGFYNPYYDGLGGGERYTLTLAAHWSKKHEVDVFWDDPTILLKAEKRFGLDLSRIHIVPNIFSGHNLIAKLLKSRTYDCIFFLTDGSVPTSLSTYTIFHVQVPFAHLSGNLFAVSKINSVVCNSLFTKEHVDMRVSVKSRVIYPPVQPVDISANTKKKNIILSVGRFTSVHHAKKQEVMIDAFIQMEESLSDWTLVLSGGLLSSDREYFASLEKKARGHRIELKQNVSYEQLLDLYRTAPLYWHAAGYGEVDPVYAEHFGITTIEAASAGAVPLVFDGGGQKEILHDNVDGLLWHTPAELIEKTLMIIRTPKTYAALQKNAKILWKRYSEEVFVSKYDALLESLTK